MVGIMKALLWSCVFPHSKTFSKIIVISSFLLLFLMRSDCFSASEYDLDLENTISKMEVEKAVYDNPHLELECEDCHEKGVSKFTKKKGAKLKFADVVKLCNSCHEGANLHPVGVNPYKVKPKITPPTYLPLGKKGKYKDRVICTTCHDIHMRRTDNNILRGFKGSSESIYARFKNHQDFCRACHKKALSKRSPHKGDKKACSFCHISDPKSTDKPETTVRLDIVKRCNFCHMKLEGAHFLAVNAFADKALKDDIKNLDLPFIGGKTTCVTCHDQHFKSKLPHKLRPEYVAFAEKSIRINPHWRGTFCLSCHDKMPKKGETPTFLFDGDIIKVCNRCHDTEEATADIHPVGMVPSDDETISIPKEFELTNGVLTCATCHDLKTQTELNEEERKRNPLFLRGGPYYDRTDICFKCHNPEAYGQQSPHIQLDNNGEVIESRCLFCHSSRPDVEVKGIRPKMFKGDVSTFCYGCHAGKEENHPVGVTHLGRDPSEERRDCIKKTEKQEKGLILPLYEDRLFCGTCHNPHQKGVLKGAASSGAGKQHKLRLPKGYEMCVACHCDKGNLR
jgi:hypothetical protein